MFQAVATGTFAQPHQSLSFRLKTNDELFLVSKHQKKKKNYNASIIIEVEGMYNYFFLLSNLLFVTEWQGNDKETEWQHKPLLVLFCFV